MPSRQIIERIQLCKPSHVWLAYGPGGGTIRLGQAMEFSASRQAVEKVLSWLEHDALYYPLKNWRDPRGSSEGEAFFERRFNA
jgi:hypothetical protein